MNNIEQYEFDRLGYLVIKDMLSRDQVRTLASTIDELEEHAARHAHLPPRKHMPMPFGGGNAHCNELGYHVHGSQGKGSTLIVEDFWNFSPAFDLLLQHQRTMQ